MANNPATSYDANIQIKDLPREVNAQLDMLCAIHDKKKWEIIREALIEYVESHRHEIIKAAS